jgi:putative ABC transport system substrate-binding protein
MRRRDFITLLGGAAAIWPLAALAQQSARIRRVGMLLYYSETDPDGTNRIAQFEQELQGLGWTIGRDLQIERRWTAADTNRLRRYAAELISLRPDVILAQTTWAAAPLQQLTETVPIVFVGATDPVGAGLVSSMSRPGGNATGFILSEYGTSGKWLELLKEIAPYLKRAAVLRDSTIAAGIGQLGAIQAVAPSLGVELTAVGLRDAAEIESSIAAFARTPSGGLIVTASVLALSHRKLIIMLADRYKLPAVYSLRPFVTDGGLMCYAPDVKNQFRLAAGYVDRILKGEKAADLPVQAPTKYELVINLKTAKALGLTVPPTLLARADEVIE